jgi:hypothetical protein
MDSCPKCGAPMKMVPAGISKKTGKPYNAFRSCSVMGCNGKPDVATVQVGDNTALLEEIKALCLLINSKLTKKNELAPDEDVPF